MREIICLRSVRLAVCAAFAVLLGACGGGSGGNSASSKEYTGAYVPQDKGIYNRMEFQPGHKVAITFIGQQRVVEYVVMPDGRLKIFGDKVQGMREMDDGCLVFTGPGDNGAEIDLVDFGRYCRQ